MSNEVDEGSRPTETADVVLDEPAKVALLLEKEAPRLAVPLANEV